MIFINNGRSVYESLQFQYQRVAMMATHLAQLSLLLHLVINQCSFIRGKYSMSYKIFCFRADRELICMVCIKLNVNFNFVNNP